MLKPEYIEEYNNLSFVEESINILKQIVAINTYQINKTVGEDISIRKNDEE